MRLVLAVLLAAMLVGCSDPTPPSPSPSSSPSSPSSPATSTDASPSPTAVAVPRPVRNGCHLLSYAHAVAPVAGGSDVACRKRHTSQTYKIGRLSLVSDGHLLAVDSPSVTSVAPPRTSA